MISTRKLFEILYKDPTLPGAVDYNKDVDRNINVDNAGMVYSDFMYNLDNSLIKKKNNNFKFFRKK